jgi:hypothetical protein
MAKVKRERTTADIVGSVILAFILLGIPAWLFIKWLTSDSPKPEPAVFSATIVDYRVIDPSTLAVQIAVNNISTSSAEPSCFITVESTTGHYKGSTLMNGDAIEPGKLKNYTKAIAISDEGATYITAGDVNCEKQK